jgi:EmrB/QacA subfamily drug resistance transporter
MTVEAASDPDEIRTRRTTPRQVLAIVCAAMVLANLDLFIVNVALPDISVEFGNARLEDLSWVLNGYAIVYAAMLVFFGRLSERYRRDMSFLLGVALFTVASGACAAANDVPSLVVFRLAQAVGAALMTPTSLGLLLATFPPEGRGGAIRAWASIGGLAAAFGPVVGGLLVTFSWRWIFLVNLPLGLLALLVGLWKLPKVPGHDVPLPDAWGAVLVTAGVAALTFGLVKASDWGWSSPGLALSLAGAVLLLATFFVHCLRARNPLIDPALFRIRAFSGASLAAVPFGISFGAMLLSLVLWEQGAWHWSALKTGLAIAPGPFLVPITSLLLAGRLIKRFGAPRVIAAGLAFFIAGCVWWALTVTLAPSLPAAIGGILLTGVGVGLTLPTIVATAAGALPPSSFATGSGVVNMIRQTGLAVGVAVLVAIVGGAVTPLDQLAAFRTAWWVMAGITAVSFLPLLLIKQSK